MDSLFVIPARGGSKTIPCKNIKTLCGIPLIEYSIQFARKFVSDKNICVSTDNKKIIEVVEKCGLIVPFIRPAPLSTDDAPTADVLLHALDFYKSAGRSFRNLILLQPTSPFRKESHLREMTKLMSDRIDMVVSVQESKANPYLNLFEENKNGFLFKSKNGLDIHRRQKAPKIYQFNGSIYIINPRSLKKYTTFNRFQKIKKYVMEKVYSVDIDDNTDWLFSEFLSERFFNQNKPKKFNE